MKYSKKGILLIHGGILNVIMSKRESDERPKHHKILEEINIESVRSATERAKQIDQTLLDTEDKQSFVVASEDQDEWNKRVSSGTVESENVNIILPGYATGDRYTLGMLLLLNDKIRIHLVYNEGDEVQRKNAEEAYTLYKKILDSQGKNIDNYVSINVMSKPEDLSLISDNPEPWNKFSNNHVYDACMIWNTKPQIRNHVHNIRGCDFPDADNSTHLFHVSVSTTLMAREFEKNAEASMSKLQVFFLNTLIPKERQKELDDIYERHFSHIQDKVIVWVSNRSNNPDLRVAEITSRPVMWEQIRAKLNEESIGSIYSGDEWEKRHSNISSDLDASQGNNHNPMQAFWKKFNITTREEQWYLMAKIMQKNKAIIGNRSGALEPFALLGMPVLYLEHKGIFTSERLAQLLGRLPTWNRVVAHESTGYGIHSKPEGDVKPYEARTEDRLQRDRAVLLNKHLEQKHSQYLRNNTDDLPHSESMILQDDIALTQEVIDRGVLTSAELDAIAHKIEEYDKMDNPSVIHTKNHRDVCIKYKKDYQKYKDTDTDYSSELDSDKENRNPNL